MGLANWLTIVRIVLIPVFVTLLVYDRMRTALLVFCLAGLTDALDGYIARTRGKATRLGAFLDPMADKLLLTASFVTLTYKFPHLLPFWLTAVVISRDLLLILGAALIHMTGGQIRPAPTPLGKATTALQMAMILAAILASTRFELAVSLRPGLVGATALLTAASGVQYFAQGRQSFNGGVR